MKKGYKIPYSDTHEVILSLIMGYVVSFSIAV